MVDIALWATVASAAVSVIGGVVSVISWLAAKGEREEAARQAKAAADAATASAGHLARIADVHEQQQKFAAGQQQALERDPWQIVPDPNHTARAELINDSDTPKFGVTVQINANGQEYLDAESIDFVGPRRHARIAYVRLDAEMAAIITWHLDDERTSGELRQIITW